MREKWVLHTTTTTTTAYPTFATIGEVSVPSLYPSPIVNAAERRDTQGEIVARHAIKLGREMPGGRETRERSPNCSLCFSSKVDESGVGGGVVEEPLEALFCFTASAVLCV